MFTDPTMEPTLPYDALGYEPLPLNPVHANPATNFLLMDDLLDLGLDPHPCELADPDDFSDGDLGPLDDVGLLSGKVGTELEVEQNLKLGVLPSPDYFAEEYGEFVKGDESGATWSPPLGSGTSSTGSGPSWSPPIGSTASAGSGAEWSPPLGSTSSFDSAASAPSYFSSSSHDSIDTAASSLHSDPPSKSSGTIDSASVYSIETLQPLEYLANIPRFPTAAPKGFPHIVRTDNFDEDVDDGELTLADGIATFIYEWNWTHLERFFGRRSGGEWVEDGYWIGVRSRERTRWGWGKEVVMGRQGAEVFAGLRNRKNEFENFVTFEIRGDGKWEGKTSTGKHSFGERRKDVEREGRYVASAILMYRRWDRTRNDIRSSD